MDKTKQFVEKAQRVHGEMYDYSLTVYEHSMRALTVVCKVHGPFNVRPNSHLSSKQGCQKCSKRHRPSLDEFKERASAIHNNKYDYSKVTYVNNKSKVEIICPTHGSFLQLPKDHIHNMSGCPECKKLVTGQYHKKDTHWFIETAQTIHGATYDYSKVDYQRYHDKVEIVCVEHGSFWQSAGAHISQKQGCPTCSAKNYEGGYGAKRFSNFPELKTKPGMLYIVECSTESERFVKVGITQFTIEKRFSGQISYDVKAIAAITGTMWELFQLEQQVKRTFKKYKYRPTNKFSGHTECFVAEQCSPIQTFVTEKSIFK